jgi:hypothetical protein
LLSVQEIVRGTILLLDDRVSIDEFGDWMLVQVGRIKYREVAPDNATAELAHTIQCYMTSLDVGEIDEQKLRGKLAEAIDPYSPKS